MDIFLNVVGLISFLLTILALHLLGVPDKRAYYIFGISCTMQIIIFYFTNQWFLILQMVALNYYNIRNYRKWKREGVGK